MTPEHAPPSVQVITPLPFDPWKPGGLLSLAGRGERRDRIAGLKLAVKAIGDSGRKSYYFHLKTDICERV